MANTTGGSAVLSPRSRFTHYLRNIIGVAGFEREGEALECTPR